MDTLRPAWTGKENDNDAGPIAFRLVWQNATIASGESLVITGVPSDLEVDQAAKDETAAASRRTRMNEFLVKVRKYGSGEAAVAALSEVDPRNRPWAEDMLALCRQEGVLDPEGKLVEDSLLAGLPSLPRGMPVWREGPPPSGAAPSQVPG